MSNILICINSDNTLPSSLASRLKEQGHEILKAFSPAEALQLLDQLPSLLIMAEDPAATGIQGFDLCLQIRRDFQNNLPILLLLHTDSLKSRQRAISCGADDYLVFPFSIEELLLKITALLRRYLIYQGENQHNRETWQIAGDLRVNEQFNEAFLCGHPVELSDIEYRMLKLFMQHRRKIFSIQNLYETIWNEPFYHSCSNTVMVHIRKLRLKIEADPARPEHIRTQWGRGYCFYT